MADRRFRAVLGQTLSQLSKFGKIRLKFISQFGITMPGQHTRLKGVRMSFKGRDIISIDSLSKEDILHILEVAHGLETKPRPTLLNGMILASVFIEPSTRTRLSFESAMYRLGGKVLGFGDASLTSMTKGESLADTARITSTYCDVIAVRHPTPGTAQIFADNADVPVINAGDGPNQHPTQTLLDMYTIKKAKGKLDNLTVGFLGDLKYGRTVHSLVTALSHFKPRFYFVSPRSLAMPPEQIKTLDSQGIEYHETDDFYGTLKHFDILYDTRIQKERFLDPAEYEKHKGVYVVDKRIIEFAKKDMKILHPLPRVDELSPELDDTPYALYFQQARNGIPVRQALLALVLGKIS
ncbi:MAG: aspartate carbamoyltransferase catalytic subunit [archaeon GW2011_AR3]|nr:MAG: aspartate carbamoyltransferase catalytic subunit [archaeon GW2011_AR3]